MNFLRGLKKFGITFLVSALIFTIAAVFVTNSLEDILLGIFDRTPDGITDILASPEVEASQGEEGAKPSENVLKNLDGSSYSMLMVCTDYRPNVYSDYLPDVDDIDKTNDEAGYLKDGFRITGASSICLVQCSKEYGQFIFTPIASNTNVSTPSGYETLYNIYGYYGFEYFMAKIESITGVSIDYYAVINCTDVKSVVDVIGAVYCTVPTDIFTDGKVYVGSTGAGKMKAVDPELEFESFLEECTDNIGPSSMGLLLYKDYSDGIEDELIITDGYAKGVFRNFAKVSEKSQSALWTRIEKYLTTNITDDFFNSNAALVKAYSDDIAATVSYPGLFKPTGDFEKSTFEPDISKGVEELSKYR